MASEPALALAWELQSLYWVNHVTGAWLQSYILLADLAGTLHYLDGVLTTVTPMDTAGKRYCWPRRADLALAMNEPTIALNIVERLINSASGLRPRDVLTFLWLVKGEALARIGQLDKGRDLLEQGRDHAQERFLLWRFHAALANLFQEAGDKDAAEEETVAVCLVIEETASTITDEAIAGSFRSHALARAR